MEYKKSHPYFQFPFINELYRGKICEIDENKKKIEQYLIITNAGFFFLRRRTFPSGFICTNAISPEFVSTVTLENEKLTIFLDSESESSDKQHKKTFISKEVIKILSMMMQVKSELFGNITINFESESLKEELKSNTPTYSSSNPNSDRFLAHAINSTPSDILNFVPRIYDMFKNGNFSFIVTQDILKSSLENSIIQTLLEMKFFFELIISNGEYSFFLDFLGQIIRQSARIKRIIFDKISFTKLAANNMIFQQNNHQTAFNSISFINGCDFSTNQFLIFLKDISKYQGNIESIIVNNCIFTEETLSSFFDHLNGVNSIKNIKYFEIDGISMSNQFQEPLTRLLNSQNHFLRCIKVSDPSLNADVVLSNSTLFDNKIEEVHFHKCSFLGTITIENFFSISTLDFSQTKFTFESLKSLFDSIKLPIRRIILNNITIENESLMKFYVQLPQYNFLFLEQFEFADNFVPTSHISHFIDFISKMKNLAILNISSAFDSNDQSTIIKISNLLRNLTNLLFLILKGSSKSAFNSEFTQIFDNLPPFLFYLDISGQNIGDEGMLQLSQFINSRSQPNDQLNNILSFTATTIGHPFLTDFALQVDGSLNYIKCNKMGCTIKGLITVMEAIIGDNQIKNAEWNENEITKLIKKVHSSDKSQIEAKIKQLKEEFDEKFSLNNENSPLSISSLSPHSLINFSVQKKSNSDVDQEINCIKKQKMKKMKENEHKKAEINDQDERKKLSDENENGETIEKKKEKKKDKTNDIEEKEDEIKSDKVDDGNRYSDENQKEVNSIEETEKHQEMLENQKDIELEKENKSIPPLIIKPTINYRAVLLDNNDQELKDQLIECVGQEAAARNPLEEALIRLEKEVPSLTIDSSTL